MMGWVELVGWVGWGVSLVGFEAWLVIYGIESNEACFERSFTLVI